MTKLEIVTTAVALVGGVIGVIGGSVGIVTALRSNRRETQRELDEQNEFSFLAAFMQKQLDVGSFAGQIFTELETGTKDWQLAEKMVQKGTLERGPKGRGYRIRGFESTKVNAPERIEKSAPEVDVDRRH